MYCTVYKYGLRKRIINKDNKLYLFNHNYILHSTREASHYYFGKCESKPFIPCLKLYDLHDSAMEVETTELSTWRAGPCLPFVTAVMTDGCYHVQY